MIKVKCFGAARELAKTDIATIKQEQMTVAELRQYLAKAYPEFSTIRGYMIAINQEYATDEQSISESDEVAIIPPVSGG